MEGIEAFDAAITFIITILICLLFGFIAGRASRISDRRAAFLLMTPLVFWLVWLIAVETVLQN